jgi:small subunit ribosomal protein S16
MLKIRLRRMGARNSPHYRIVVSDSRSTARAEVLEELGSYDPKREPTVISFDQDRARYWIGRGANVSPTVKSLLERKPAAEAAAGAPAS